VSVLYRVFAHLTMVLHVFMFLFAFIFVYRGSTKPVGTGACPTGYYCPTQVLAIPCEPGHYCPGTGNVYPLPCFPGSYSSTSGQSSCKMCEIGFQCPGFNRTFAEVSIEIILCSSQAVTESFV
jgi:hypothetical protein